MRLALDPADPRIVHMSFDNERTECGQDAGEQPAPGRRITCDECRVHAQAHAAKVDVVIRQRRAQRRDTDHEGGFE